MRLACCKCCFLLHRHATRTGHSAIERERDRGREREGQCRASRRDLFGQYRIRCDFGAAESKTRNLQLATCRFIAAVAVVVAAVFGFLPAPCQLQVTHLSSFFGPKIIWLFPRLLGNSFPVASNSLPSPGPGSATFSALAKQREECRMRLLVFLVSTSP